ncbi:MAG: beta-ketoacyl-ACP synthase II [Chloroflexi bacterium]|nr:beta-ketoacyl-ACP synthase II [Chloroflexota bacterium]
MKRRVVITGLGAVTPIGIGIGPSWQALCAGVSGITRVTRFDTSNLRAGIAGEVKGFNPEDFIDHKLARRTDRYQHFALAAARMALEDARFEIPPSEADRVGVIVGTATGGLQSMLSAQAEFSNGSSDEISPFFILQYLTNIGAGQVALLAGARGPNFAPTSACASGTHSVGDGFKLIQHGACDMVLAGGADAGIIPIMLHGLGLMKACSQRTDMPEKASRPFELNRDGFVTGEGAAILVLEELDHALRRGAGTYAEIVGYAATGDAYHITSPSPQGEGAGRCIRLALEDAGVSPADVDYVNAHGTSTRLNDVAETRAIKAVFGKHASRLAVSSNKSMIGHLWGASGAVEAAFTALTLKHGVVPPTINYETPDPECDLDYVPNRARRMQVRIAISNSFGFGGTNGVLVFRRFEA